MTSNDHFFKGTFANENVPYALSEARNLLKLQQIRPPSERTKESCDVAVTLCPFRRRFPNEGCW
jgi:hypothetical protein